MTNTFVPIIFLTCAALLLMASAGIVAVHERRSLVKTEDVIDEIEEKIRLRTVASKGKMTVKRYIMLALSGACIGAAAGAFFFMNWIYVFGFAVVGFALPEIYLMFNRQSQSKDFDAKYMQCLNTLSSELKAGSTIMQAVEGVGRSKLLDETLREEFMRIGADIRMNVPVDTAFENFAKRVQSNDAADIATAIRMQMKVGGSEALVVENIAMSIRNRIMLRKEANALLMEAKITVYVTDVLPVVMLWFIMFGGGDFMNDYTSSPMMMAVLIGLIALIVFGIFLTRKMTASVLKIKV